MHKMGWQLLHNSQVEEEGEEKEEAEEIWRLRSLLRAIKSEA